MLLVKKTAKNAWVNEIFSGLSALIAGAAAEKQPPTSEPAVAPLLRGEDAEVRTPKAPAVLRLDTARLTNRWLVSVPCSSGAAAFQDRAEGRRRSAFPSQRQ